MGDLRDVLTMTVIITIILPILGIFTDWPDETVGILFGLAVLQAIVRKFAPRD